MQHVGEQGINKPVDLSFLALFTALSLKTSKVPNIIWVASSFNLKQVVTDPFAVFLKEKQIL